MSAVVLALVGAAAAAPSGAVHAWGALGQHGRDDLMGGGLGGALGLPLSERLHLELAAEAGLGGSLTPWVAARPELRFFLSPRQAPVASLSVTAGGGVRWADQLHPDIALGAALDLPGTGRFAPRLAARTLLDPTGEGSTILLTAGVSWPRPQPPPQPEPQPAPPSAPLHEPLPPPEPYVWVPHPVSACVLESELARMTGGAMDAPGTPGAPTGHATSAVAVLTPLDLQALMNPSQGSLVVAAHPGDQVVVGQIQLPLGDDWTAVTTVAEGPVEVTILGAGRVQHLSPSIAAGYAVWMRSNTDLSPHIVTFDQGSAELSEADLVWLRGLVDKAGLYRFELLGSYSPEGTDRLNRELAQRRAVAVRDALLAAGLSLDQIVLLPSPQSADPDGDPARQRACIITPAAPAGGPP